MSPHKFLILKSFIPIYRLAGRVNWISQPTYSERLQSQGHPSTFQTSETICGKPAGSYKKNPKTSSTVTIPTKARQWSSTPSTLGSRPSTMLKTDLKPDIYSHIDPCPASFPIRASSVGFFAVLCHTFRGSVRKEKKTKPSPTISAGPDLMYLVFGEQTIVRNYLTMDQWLFMIFVRC